MAAVMLPAPARKGGAPRQVVFSFDEGAPETRTPAVRGGKGAALAEMTALGLPVPPGFTVTTTVARAFSQNGHVPKRVVGQFDRALRKLERQTGKVFGDPDDPLLVSVRSGAQVSMPGMMDTVLNVGLTPANVAGLARLYGERFAFDVYYRFLVQFGTVVLGVSSRTLERIAGPMGGEQSSRSCERLRGIISVMAKRPVPDDPYEQLTLSLEAVLQSWTSERAAAYRQANSLPSWWGTAVTVQEMVFGNRGSASGTGVVFSHDVATGQPGLYGEFLPQAQGEDIVAGTHDPLPISALAEWNPAVYRDLERLVALLVDYVGDIVDVEFTVEEGKLYLLQVRPAKRSALASVIHTVHQVWAGHTTREQAVESVSSIDVMRLQRKEFDLSNTRYAVLTRGLAASPGAAVGRVVTSSAEAQVCAARGEQVVLVARDTTPDDLPGMLCAQAFITGNGGATCHAAVVAREQGVPAVVGVGESGISQLAAGQLVSVDGTRGVVYDDAVPFTTAALAKEARVFLRWHTRFVASQPRIGFEWCDTTQNINRWLNDFYLTDAMATASKDSRLESVACELRTKLHRDAAEMLAAYLMLAVGGEIRHAFTKTHGVYPMQLDQLQRFGVVSGARMRSKVQSSVYNALKHRPATDHIEFFRLCMEIFDCGQWFGSFGGDAWARIAQAGFQFLSGELSPTVFVDHVFDLRHNGGVLFNKHGMVKTRTDEQSIAVQLHRKQYATTVVDLYRALSPFATFSASVRTMYQDGFDAGLW